MKKYLMTGIAALAMCAGFTSCSHDLSEPTQQEINEMEALKVTNTYNKAFIAKFGQPDPDHDWGFGTAAGTRTRGVDYTLKTVTPKYSEPAKPSFTSKETVNGRKPTISIEGYLTKAGDVTATTSGIPAANTISDWSKATAAYLSSGNTNATDAYPVTLYVVDNITYGSNTKAGTVFVVTEGKTLKLTSLSQNTKVILAEGATLDLTEKPSWAYEGYMHTITFDGDQSGLYMSKNSHVNAITVSFFNGCQAINNEGSISASTKIQVDKNSIFWNDGEFETVTLYMENENSTVYNAKGRTLNATNITTGNNYGLLYNDGTVKATGNIDLHNTNAELVNAGTLEAGSISLAAGGKFFNSDNCLTTIHGLTYITNTSAEWLNKGEYNSGDFTIYNAGKLYNDCKLTVHADADGTTGTFAFDGTTQNSFVIMANSSVKTDYFKLTAEGDMWMKENALLWITTKLTSSNLNPETGFHGTGDGYSFIKAADIDYTSAQRWRMNYFGKIFVDADKHFPQNFDTSNVPADQPHYYFDTTVKFKHHNDACPITSKIAEGKCYHGYTPPTTVVEEEDDDDEEEDEEEEESEIRIIGEDLTPGETDWDFNDVVFSVSYSGSTATCTLLAAGGTLPLRISTVANEQNDASSNWVEVHELYGVNTNVMVNTGGISTTVDKKPTFTVTGVDSSKKGKDIIIKVNKGKNGQDNWVELTAKQGDPAAKLAVGKGFKICIERQNINTVYKRFTDWVGNKEIVWY